MTLSLSLFKIDPPTSDQPNDKMSCSSEDCDTDQETDRLLGAQRAEDRPFFEDKVFWFAIQRMCVLNGTPIDLFFLSKIQKQPIKKKANSSDGMNQIAFLFMDAL